MSNMPNKGKPQQPANPGQPPKGAPSNPPKPAPSKPTTPPKKGANQ